MVMYNRKGNLGQYKQYVISLCTTYNQISIFIFYDDHDNNIKKSLAISLSAGVTQALPKFLY